MCIRDRRFVPRQICGLSPLADSNPRNYEDKYRRQQICCFCYGKKHDRQVLSVTSLLSFDGNEKEASTKKTKGVNHAFAELKNHPDVYRRFLRKGQDR